MPDPLISDYYDALLESRKRAGRDSRLREIRRVQDEMFKGGFDGLGILESVRCCVSDGGRLGCGSPLPDLQGGQMSFICRKCASERGSSVPAGEPDTWIDGRCCECQKWLPVMRQDEFEPRADRRYD